MRIAFFVFLLTASLSQGVFADGKRGLTLGLGGVTSETVGDNDPIFPAIRSDRKQFMFLPNIQYQWDDWSIGANGIGWSKANEEGLSPSVTVGYPMSSASLMGQREWFRYGVSGGLTYADGTAGQLRATLGPLNYTLRGGLAERSDEFGQEVSLGVPVYLNGDLGITVIGSGYLKFENAALLESDLSLTQTLTDTDYVHSGINVFAIYQINERASLLLSTNMQFNDRQLTNQLPTLNDPQFDVFTMFSYFFGKLPTEAD